MRLFLDALAFAEGGLYGGAQVGEQVLGGLRIMAVGSQLEVLVQGIYRAGYGNDLAIGARNGLAYRFTPFW